MPKTDNRHLNAPNYRDVFTLHDGTVLICGPGEAQRTLDRRGEGARPVTVWELTVRGVVRRVWPNELRSWVREDVTGKPQGELKRTGEDQAGAEQMIEDAVAKERQREVEPAPWLRERAQVVARRDPAARDVAGEASLEREIREAQRRSRGLQ